MLYFIQSLSFDVLLEISDLKVGMATLLKIMVPYWFHKEPLEYLHFL